MLWSTGSLRNGKGENMFKKALRWVMIVPIRLAAWLLWPVVKLHSYLRKLADKLCDATIYL